jgi:predicted nuclease of restriction endonuclease-like (RecB) superfamily
MRVFAEAWPDEPIVQAVLAQITWYHNIAILEKLTRFEDRIGYANATIQHGSSRNTLVHQIETGHRAFSSPEKLAVAVERERSL